MSHQLVIQLTLILAATILLAIAIWLLSIYKRLFTGVKNIWLRRNLAVFAISFLATLACLALIAPQLILEAKGKNFIGIMGKELFQIMIIVVFVFNVVWLTGNSKPVRKLSFAKQHGVIVPVMILSTVFMNGLIRYVDNGMKFPDNLHYSLIFSYFNALVAALIYAAVNYVELDRMRKLNEKELEVTRLMALKTKAELDALHSKVNPHFLYNALNSIADLSITDGKKARKMTIALADLFRYSINYNQNNYSTVNDEVAMTEVYLQIEKIRFEDQLNYTVSVEEDMGHYLVPRFLLQPLAENAVKHGLKVTGSMTEIFLEVKKEGSGLVIHIADNGPLFPEELTPGYGVKSVFDKMDLLFPGQYEIHFTNNPRKQVSIHIHKLVKNEPGL